MSIDRSKAPVPSEGAGAKGASETQLPESYPGNLIF
jgi:hypothetical protein